MKEDSKMKLALCGKMASGKTTMALKLGDEFGFSRFSLAKGVKDFGNFLFEIPEGHKDRVAYQKVGDGGETFFILRFGLMFFLGLLMKAVAKM